MVNCKESVSFEEFLYNHGMFFQCRVVFRSMRPKHWIKNLLVFSLPLSDGRIIGSNFNNDSLWRATVMFVCLNAMSSANYIFNDLIDIELDRNHDQKKFRVFASNQMSAAQGFLIAFVLITFSLGISMLLINMKVSILVGVFGLLQITYTLIFKHLSGYDLIVLSGLYVYRAIIPAEYENIQVSNWYLLLVFAAALFLSSGKRYAEISNASKLLTRKTMKSYTEVQLLLWIAVSLSLLLISYINWAFTFLARQGLFFLIASLLVMMVILIRISFFVTSKDGEDPINVVFMQKDLLVLMTIWLFLYLGGKGYLWFTF